MPRQWRVESLRSFFKTKVAKPCWKRGRVLLSSYIHTFVPNLAPLNRLLLVALLLAGVAFARVAAVPATLSQTYNSRDWLNGDTYTANGSTVTGRLSPLAPGLAPEPSGTDVYDFEERLILRTKPDGTTINISYDADGHRVAKNILDATAQSVSSTSWLVDTNNLTGYAQVLEERFSPGPSPLAAGLAPKVVVYTYGSSLISQAVSVSSASSVFSYFSVDGHGSVRELTDASGNVTDRYDYDAFGNLTFKSGVTENAYRYSGEQYDADLGLYYNRARYLNTDSGRFWSMDSYQGGRGDPMSLHKYLYASANPMMFRDPSGHFSMVEIMQAVQAVGTIAMIAIPTITSATAAVAPYVIALGTSMAIGNTIRLVVDSDYRNERLSTPLGVSGVTIDTAAAVAGLPALVNSVRASMPLLRLVAGGKQPASVDELIAMMNSRPNTTASYAVDDMLRYLKANEAEASHMITAQGSDLQFIEGVATRRTAFHEWLHRYLQTKNGKPMPGEDEFIEDFLTRWGAYLRL
jgi:RHS repeat-associated protein